MSRPRCYVAGPLGFTEPGRSYYEGVLLPALGTVVDPVDPWSLVPEAELRWGRGDAEDRRLALRIAEANLRAIDGCDAIVAVLDGQEVDSGTAAELGYATAKGIPGWGLRTDFRSAGEPGVRVNLMIEGMIVRSGGELVPSLEALLASLSSFGGAPEASGPAS